MMVGSQDSPACDSVANREPGRKRGSGAGFASRVAIGMQTTPMDSDARERRAVLAKLDRLSALIFARDATVVDELWSGAGFRLVGSEPGESAQTREELAALIGALFAKPFRVSWFWEQCDVTHHGDLAWVLAEGRLETTYVDRVEGAPYRLLGIFQKIDDCWRWRLFSGSEPARHMISAADSR